MTSDNKALIQSFQSSLEQKFRGADIDLAPFFHPEAVWHIPQSSPSVSDCVGRAQVLQLFSGVVSDYYQPDTMSFEYHHFTAEDDRVSMLFTLSAITAKGDDYRNLYHSLFRILDGKIIEVWESLDTAYLFAMMTPEAEEALE